MTQTFYHLSSTILQTGSVIKAGNYGRMLGHYASNSPPGNLHNLLREQVYETIRVRHCPDMPSRFKSIFLFPDIESARHLQAQRPFDLVYEIRIVDSEKHIHTGGMFLGNDQTWYPQYLSFLRSCAVRFWAGKAMENNPNIMESITESSVKVCKLLDQVPSPMD